jgi:hypothetical protein
VPAGEGTGRGAGQDGLSDSRRTHEYRAVLLRVGDRRIEQPQRRATLRGYPLDCPHDRILEPYRFRAEVDVAPTRRHVPAAAAPAARNDRDPTPRDRCQTGSRQTRVDPRPGTGLDHPRPRAGGHRRPCATGPGRLISCPPSRAGRFPQFRHCGHPGEEHVVRYACVSATDDLTIAVDTTGPATHRNRW